MTSDVKTKTKKLLKHFPKEIGPDSDITKMIFAITELFYLKANRFLRRFNLTLEQSAVLTHLYENEGISQKELAKHTLKDQANTTRILKRMLEKGFVTRINHEQDKRQNLIYLTPEGERLVEKMVPIFYKAKSDVMRVLSNSETAELGQLLYRFYQNISGSFSRCS